VISSDDLQVFLAAFRTQSLAAAAAALGVDRTTVGRRLDAMQEQLHTPLFARSRGGLVPTESARQLRESAERILSELRALESAAHQSDVAVRGEVRIATTDGLATYLVRRGLLELTGRYPELALELIAGNRPIDLARGEADLALRTVVTKAADVRVRRLAAMPVGLFASASYVQRHPTPLHAEDLDGHSVLLPSGELGRLPEARLLAKAAGARVALRSSSLPALVEAAIAGLGIVPLSAPWAQAVGLLQVLPLPEIPPRSLWLAVASAQRERPAVRVVAEAIAQLAGSKALAAARR
jgi:DNA-binding transcriptional LysR family regulator